MLKRLVLASCIVSVLGCADDLRVGDAYEPAGIGDGGAQDSSADDDSLAQYARELASAAPWVLRPSLSEDFDLVLKFTGSSQQPRGGTWELRCEGSCPVSDAGASELIAGQGDYLLARDDPDDGSAVVLMRGTYRPFFRALVNGDSLLTYRHVNKRLEWAPFLNFFPENPQRNRDL